MASPARPQTAPPQLAAFGYGGLTRRHNTGKRLTSKRFVVAVDGSRLGYRAVRLAAWLINEETHDRVQCVSVAKGITSTEAMQLITEAESLLKSSGVPLRAILPGRVLSLDEGSSLAMTLARAAQGAHLVMGAGGARLQKESEGRKTTAAAAVGSVALEAMGKCQAPVILAKPKGVTLLENPQFLTKRREGAGMSIVVTVDSSQISQKCLDMTLRIAKPGDHVQIVHVTNSDQQMMRPGAANRLLGESAVMMYYKNECNKARVRLPDVIFEVEAVPIMREGVVDTILAYSEERLADLIIIGSVALAKLDGPALGSITAAVAKKTQANVLIAKHFA